MNYLTLASILKDEHDYMSDFVKYHKFVGVEKFVFYDREYHKLHHMFKDDPSVTVIHFPEPKTHADAWCEAVRAHQTNTVWLALIDADQALVPMKTFNVKEVLEDYKNYAALQMNWHTFGAGGQDKKTNGSLYERFIKRAKATEGVNAHTQSIVQPSKIEIRRWSDPHHAPVKNGQISVNENKVRVQGPFSNPPSHNILWCAHYYTKSKEEWNKKNAKGRADIPGQFIPSTLFEEYNKFCNNEEELRVRDIWGKII